MEPLIILGALVYHQTIHILIWSPLYFRSGRRISTISRSYRRWRWWWRRRGLWIFQWINSRENSKLIYSVWWMMYQLICFNFIITYPDLLRRRHHQFFCYANCNTYAQSFTLLKADLCQDIKTWMKCQVILEKNLYICM